jgi:integrase
MPKLPRNMVKRGSRFYFRKVVGGRVKRMSLGSDYDKARDKLRSLKNEGCSTSAETVESAAQRWLSSYIPTARTKRGCALATQRVRDYLVPKLGHLLLHRLTPADVRAYRISLERSHLSLQSTRHVLSDLRCMLIWCVDSGLIVRSPFPRKVLPKIQERAPDRLSDEDLLKVCSVPDPHGLVCRFLASTGLRWGEATRAEASDVQGGLLIVHQTKSGKVRRVPLPSEFCGKAGRLVPFESSGAFARQVEKLSGVKFHVHQLRHTFACRWLEKGGSLAALQELLGHSTIVTTQRYGRLAETHVQAEAAKVGRLVPQVVTGQNVETA